MNESFRPTAMEMIESHLKHESHDQLDLTIAFFEALRANDFAQADRLCDEQGFALDFTLPKSKLTVLHLLCFGKSDNPENEGKPSVEAIQYLLDKGVDVNAKDSQELTPLHYAVSCGNLMPVCKVLLEAGADPNVRGRQTKARGGSYPYDLMDVSSGEEHVELIELLISYGWKADICDIRTGLTYLKKYVEGRELLIEAGLWDEQKATMAQIIELFKLAADKNS